MNDEREIKIKLTLNQEVWLTEVLLAHLNDEAYVEDTEWLDKHEANDLVKKIEKSIGRQI